MQLAGFFPKIIVCADSKNNAFYIALKFGILGKSIGSINEFVRLVDLCLVKIN